MKKETHSALLMKKAEKPYQFENSMLHFSILVQIKHQHVY